MSALARTFGDYEFATPVPACPGWTVHDVLAHLAGAMSDALAGRLAGAPGEAWTAAQIEARRDVPGPALLDEWDGAAPIVEPLLPAAGDLGPMACIDAATHEQDIRAALGRPGARDNEVITATRPIMLAGLHRQLTADGVPALEIVVDGARHTVGAGEPVCSLHIGAYELFRVWLGRRSAAQIAALDWRGGDPAAYQGRLHVFGPSPVDLVE